MAWGGLPELRGRVKLGAPQPAAKVLATDGAGDPVLVAQPYGKGRTIAFAADSTWRWVLSEEDTANYYKRFWRQLALWLAGREDRGGTLVFLSMNEVRYRMGERVRLRAVVEDKEGDSVPDADVVATVTGPDGQQTPVAFRFDDGRYGATFFPPLVGDYEVKLSASLEGKAVGKDSGRFLVFERDLELDEPEAKPANLAVLASGSAGGKYFPADKFDEALDMVGKIKSVTKLKKAETFDIWDTPVLFYVFTALLCIEWALRKAAGLV